MKSLSSKNIFWIIFFLLFLCSSSSLYASTKKHKNSSQAQKTKVPTHKVSSKSKKKKPSKAINSSHSLERKEKGKIHIVKKGETLYKISKLYGISPEEIKKANHLTSEKLSLKQKLIIPGKNLSPSPVEEGHPLVHEKTAIPSEPPKEESYITHQIAKGENLYRISKKYAVPLDEILRINQVSPQQLKPGMTLKIPKSKPSYEVQNLKPEKTKQALPQEPQKIYYIVKKGDTLQKIAKKNGITLEELKRLNHLSAKRVKPGQKLLVKILPPVRPEERELPAAGEDKYHIVKPGETLYSIALLYQVPLEKLMEANHLENNIIVVGQKLRIPPKLEIAEKPFVLQSPKESLESKEESLSQKFEKNILDKKNKILTPAMLSKEGEKALQQKFIELSANLADARYKLGGTGNGYLDCSAFVKLVYEELGINLPRSSLQQYQVGVPVERSELIPGDLVFFKTNGKRISHVGIYIGDNRFIHISSSRKRVSIDVLDDPYFQKRYAGAKRVLNGEVLEYFQDYLNKAQKDNSSKKSLTNPSSENTTSEAIL
nr:C40 family peptidase [Caldimicrobium thiodismutans]